MIRDVTVHYKKDTPTNASEVLAVNFLIEIGRIRDEERLTPEVLAERLGRALIASDESLQEFVRRYAVIVDARLKGRSNS